MLPSSALEAIRALEERVSRIERALGSEILGAAVPLAAKPAPVVPPVPKPPAAKPRPERSGLELGTTWFARLGIGLLVVGFVLFANYLFKSFGPGEKAAFVYVVALVVGGLGLWLRRKYQDYGELLVGGAWAIAFFMTYALHAVDATRLVDSPYAAALLLLAVAVAALATSYALGMARFQNVALAATFFSVLISQSDAPWLALPLLVATAVSVGFTVLRPSVATAAITLVGVYVNLGAWLGSMAAGTPAYPYVVLLLLLAVFFFGMWTLIRWAAARQPLLATPQTGDMLATLNVTGAYAMLLLATAASNVSFSGVGVLVAHGVCAALLLCLGCLGLAGARGSRTGVAIDLGAALAVATLGALFHFRGVDLLAVLGGLGALLFAVGYLLKVRPALQAGVAYAAVSGIIVARLYSHAGLDSWALWAWALAAGSSLLVLGGTWLAARTEELRGTGFVGAFCFTLVAASVLADVVPGSWVALSWIALAAFVFASARSRDDLPAQHVGVLAMLFASIRLMSAPALPEVDAAPALYYLSVAAAVVALASFAGVYRQQWLAAGGGANLPTLRTASWLCSVLAVAQVAILCTNEVPRSWITLSWSIVGLLAIAASFLSRQRELRIAGEATLLLAVLRLLVVDLSRFETVYRILSFIGVGVVALVVAYTYNRYQEALKRYF